MQHFKFDMRAWTQLASLVAAASLFSRGCDGREDDRRSGGDLQRPYPTDR